MSGDRHLFPLAVKRLVPGRVRKGLEADIQLARDKDVTLQASGMATLRTLADQIDATERQLRDPHARPYDRIPLSGMIRQFDDTYDRVFSVLAQDSDPLALALALFMDSEAQHEHDLHAMEQIPDA
jgi:hypothetical protein